MQVNAEIVRKAWNKGSYRTHCKRGHEFIEKNVMINDRGARSCRQCHNDRMDARYRGEVLPGTVKLHVWDDKSVDLLKKLWPDNRISAISKKMGCAKQTISKKAKALGLIRIGPESKNTASKNLPSRNFEERRIVKSKLVSLPVHSTAMLLMLPCKGLGLESGDSEATKASIKRYKDSELLIKAEIESGIGITRTAEKYGLAYRTLKRFFEDEGYKTRTRSKE